MEEEDLLALLEAETAAAQVQVAAQGKEGGKKEGGMEGVRSGMMRL